jgi:outer membrane protein OmpA-like peptidoglycan-associated protein
VNITPQIESDGDQYVSSVSFDGTQLYLTREDPFNSDIYVSHFDQNKWSKSMPVEGQDVNTKYWESHASISANGKTLYFTSNRKGGLGEMDIYKTSLQESGQWGPPVNLGASVNTALNDDTPFITDNDSLLFFSSQGHENMGGYDLFVSNLDSAGSWSEALNLRYPCSTTDDDLFYYPWHNGTVGYVSVIRPGGLGKEDIYAVQSESAPPLHEFLTAFFKSAEPVVVEQTLVKLPEQLSSVEETAAVPEPIQDKKSEDTVADMPPAAKNAMRIIELTPVYFAFDNFQLNPEGAKQLNEIYKLLQEFPNLKVQITGHADAKGPENYNLLLSVKRAEAVVKYLTDKGIANDRLTIQGMGEKNFAAINTYADGSDCPEGRRLNRRVEYKVIEPERQVVIIQFPPIPEQFRPQ